MTQLRAVSGYAPRVCCTYTVINLFLVLLALKVPALRGFVVCNTMLILALTFVAKTVDPVSIERSFHSFGMYDNALMAFSDFTNHVLPLFLIYAWAPQITVFTAALSPVLASLYRVVVCARWVYGTDVGEQPIRAIVCASACYAMLVIGSMLTARFGVASCIVFLVACVGVIYAVAYVPSQSALKEGVQPVPVRVPPLAAHIV